MPWKDDYTTSDERALPDDELVWPDDRQCCAMITVDLSPATQAEGVTERDLALDRATFGSGEGFDAVVALLDRFGLKATFAVPAVLASSYGDDLVRLQDAGHDIAVNGFRHEDVSELSRAEEEARLGAATELVASVIGQEPAGWFSLPRQSDPFAVGTISPNTIELLADSGYRYFCPGLADDIPYYWVADFETCKGILTMPYYYHFDDQFFLMFPSRGTGLEHADALYANWVAEYDAQRDRGRCFSMVLHPYAVAWCNRQRRLELFLEHLTDGSATWNPTAAECARYWLERYPMETHLKLSPSIWQDYEGSLS